MVLKSLGFIYYECKQYEKSLQMFERAIEVVKEKGEDDPDIYNYKAIILAKLRCCNVFLEEAFNACENATGLAPKNYEIWSNKGMAYYFLEDYSKAVEAFEKAINIATKEDRRYNKNLRGKEEKADTHYEFSMKGLSHFKLGSQEEYKKAYKCFLEALKQNPDDVETLNLKGIVLYRLNEPTKAKEAFQKALSIDPSDLFTRNNLGWLLLNFGNSNEAYSQIKGHLIKYDIEKENTGEDSFYEINKTGEKLRLCTREFDRYARIMGWGWCLKGQILIEKLNYTEAIDAFEQAIKWDKTFSLYLLWSSYARYLKAEFYYGDKSKKYHEELVSIVRDLEKIKSHENNRVDAYALYFLGICYCKMGNYHRAKERLVECIDLKMEKEKYLKKLDMPGSVLEQSYKKLMEIIDPKREKPQTEVQIVAKKLLDNIWTNQIKPPWYIWWFYSPSHRIIKPAIFIIILIFIVTLAITGVTKSTEHNLSQYLIAEIALIFVLFSPSIYRIAGKDISIEIQSPTFSAVEFYPEMPPFNLEDARPIKDIRSKHGSTGENILFFNIRDLLKK